MVGIAAFVGVVAVGKHSSVERGSLGPECVALGGQLGDLAEVGVGGCDFFAHRVILSRRAYLPCVFGYNLSRNADLFARTVVQLPPLCGPVDLLICGLPHLR